MLSGYYFRVNNCKPPFAPPCIPDGLPCAAPHRTSRDGFVTAGLRSLVPSRCHPARSASPRCPQGVSVSVSLSLLSLCLYVVPPVPDSGYMYSSLVKEKQNFLPVLLKIIFELLIFMHTEEWTLSVASSAPPSQIERPRWSPWCSGYPVWLPTQTAPRVKHRSHPGPPPTPIHRLSVSAPCPGSGRPHVQHLFLHCKLVESESVCFMLYFLSERCGCDHHPYYSVCWYFRLTAT